MAQYPIAFGWTSGPRGAGAPIHVHANAIATLTTFTDVVFVRNFAAASATGIWRPIVDSFQRLVERRGRWKGHGRERLRGWAKHGGCDQRILQVVAADVDGDERHAIRMRLRNAMARRNWLPAGYEQADCCPVIIELVVSPLRPSLTNLQIR